MIEEESEHGPVLVARAVANYEGWVTVAKWQDGDPGSGCSEFLSSFLEPEIGWPRVFEKAERLDDLWALSDDLWQEAQQLSAQLARLQDLVRDESPASAAADGAEPALMDERNDVRRATLERTEEYLREVEAARQASQGWCGGRTRELQVEEAQQQAEELRVGLGLDVYAELQRLQEHKMAVVRAKIARRTADTYFKNARDLGADLKDALENRRAMQEEARAAERRYFTTVAKLCRLASRHAPEMLPALVGQTNEAIAVHLRKLSSAEQDQVLQVLTTERELAHYDNDLSDEFRLSGKAARHAVYKMTYQGDECVLKVFDLHTHRGLPGFLQEVILHVRLRHPLVVPLRYAFLDWDEHRGFLHFDKYKCDLAGQLERLASRRFPHRIGEPPTAGLPDRMAAVRRMVHAMIQSVQHVHTNGYRHGDLKLSNWLWNDRSGLPCLCDFETARDCGEQSSQLRGGGTTGPYLGTAGYVAPELLDNPLLPPTRESDMYALGRSIQQVLQLVADSRRTSPERHALEKLAEDMTRNSPGERITAAQAAERWWSSSLSVSDGITTQVLCDELRYTQEWCSSMFTDGRPLTQLIEAVVRDPELPLRDERLVLDVVQKGQVLFSLCNRRLFCFKKAQTQLPEGRLWIRVKLYQHCHIWDRFQGQFNARSGGRSILVKRGRFRELSELRRRP